MAFNIFKLFDLLRTEQRTNFALPSSFAIPQGDPMCVAAISRCVGLIANTIAAMQLKHERTDAATGAAKVISGELSTLLTIQPNPDESAYQLWNRALRRMLVDGVAYIYPKYKGLKISELRLVDASYNELSKRYTVNDEYAGVHRMDITEGEIIALRMPDVYGISAPGVSFYAQRVISLAVAGDMEAVNRIANGGGTRLILSTETMQTGLAGANNTNLDDFASRMSERFKAGEAVVAGRPGLQVTNVGSSAADMQFQGMREFAIQEICRFYGVPPMLAYCQQGGNYKTVEAASTDFLTNTIGPLTSLICSELRRKLIAPNLWSNQRFRFDTSDRVAMEPQARAQFLTSMLAIGVTVNEIRSNLGMAPVDGGDVALVSANLRPLNEQNQL